MKKLRPPFLNTIRCGAKLQRLVIFSEKLFQPSLLYDLHASAHVLCGASMTDEKGIGGVYNNDILQADAPD